MNCRHCQKPIEDAKPWQRFHKNCAAEHKKMMDRARQRNKQPVKTNFGEILTCPICGKSFAREGAKHRFCSRACYGKNRYERKVIPKLKEKVEVNVPGWGIPEAPVVHPLYGWFISLNLSA